MKTANNARMARILMNIDDAWPQRDTGTGPRKSVCSYVSFIHLYLIT